eukprot:UN15025
MPLTCFHMVHNLYIKTRTSECKSLNIHMLGVESELLNIDELQSHFIELLKIKNQNLKNIQLILIGPKIKSEQVKKIGNIHIYSGLWNSKHNAVKEFPPDIIIALNAGLT